jgi:cell division septation protein DedD
VTDIEGLLTRTLSDERRVLPTTTDVLAGVRAAERRIRARRRATTAAAAVAAVSAIATGLVVLGSASADRGRVPTDIASVTPSLTASAAAGPALGRAPSTSPGSSTRAEPSPSPQPSPAATS